MALFRKKDAAKRRVRHDVHKLALAQAQESYDFWGEEQLAYDSYVDTMETAGVRPEPYHTIVKELTK